MVSGQSGAGLGTGVGCQGGQVSQMEAFRGQMGIPSLADLCCFAGISRSHVP